MLRAFPLAQLLPGLLVACTFAGCNGDGGASPRSTAANPIAPIPTSAQPASARGKDGRFTGKVTIGGVSYYGDAILTTDGEMRMYVADAYDGGSGLLQGATPRSSAQLVGKVDMRSAGPVGTGYVVGEHCSATGNNRFCRAAASADIRIAEITGEGWSKRLTGEIRIRANEAEEIWQLALGHWVNYYDGPATMSAVAALWDEQLAEFAGDGDTIVRIDGTGRLFFQSARSGCTGNGTVLPHLDGKFRVFDVSLNIGACSTGYASLNGDFNGLASTTASSVWNYDDVLRIWLSKPEGTPRVAITMLAYARY